MTPPIIAVEGPGGAGKSTLAHHLAPLLGASLIKRPLANPPEGVDVAEYMDADQEACLKLIEHAKQPRVLADRWWLSKAIYQTPETFEQEITAQANRFGEPTVWVIVTAPAHVLLDRLSARAADGRAHLDRPRSLYECAGRLALYDAALQLLKAPVIQVRLVPPTYTFERPRLEVRSRARGSRWLPSPAGPGDTDAAHEIHLHILSTLNGLTS